LRYQFPPPEHKHLLGPFTTGQIAITLVTLFVAVFGIARPNPTLARIVLAAGLVLAVLVPVAVPWRGRIVTEWVPIAARYLRARRAGRTDYRTSAGRQGTSAAGRVLLPAEVGAVEFLAHPHNGRVLGVVVDRRAGLYTAVLEVESPSFLLEETARQEELMARWGVVLARLASSGTSVHRLQWVVRTVPDDGSGTRNYLKRAQAPDLDQASAVIRSYLELLRVSGPASSEHTTLLAVQLSSRHSVPAIRAAGGGDHGACASWPRLWRPSRKAWTAARSACAGCSGPASTRGPSAPPSTPTPWPTSTCWPACTPTGSGAATRPGRTPPKSAGATTAPPTAPGTGPSTWSCP
jgi:hypothetical protein